MGSRPAWWSSIERRALEGRLEALVRARRFEIAVVFPAVGAVLLLASAAGALPAPLAFNPLLVLVGVSVMRLPLVAMLLPALDRRAALGLLGVVAYAYAIELLGVATGWPYGAFEYLVALGPMAFGLVPIGLPVFFLPLVLNAYLLVHLLFPAAVGNARVRLPATLAVVLLMDLVLDPGAVGLGFWAYAAGGAYYGVPASNYLGWLLSGTVAVVAFDVALPRQAVLDRLDACSFALDDLVSFVILWGAVNAAFGQWLPVALAAGLGLALVRTERFDVAMKVPFSRR